MRDKLTLDEWVSMLRSAALEAPGADDTISRLPPVSLAVSAIDRVPTVKELVDSIIHGAEEILDSWQFLATR